MMGATSGTGTSYPAGAPMFTSSFQWCSCYSIFCFMCMFCRSLFVLLYFSFCHYVVCFSSIYGFGLSLWYLQTLLQPDPFIEVPLPSHEYKLACICVLEVSFVPLSVIFRLHYILLVV